MPYQPAGFAGSAVGETLGELAIAVLFEAMEHQRTEQDFAAGVFRAILPCQPGLEGFSAGFELSDLLFDRFAGHGHSSVLAMIYCGGGWLGLILHLPQAMWADAA